MTDEVGRAQLDNAPNVAHGSVDHQHLLTPRVIILDSNPEADLLLLHAAAMVARVLETCGRMAALRNLCLSLRAKRLLFLALARTGPEEKSGLKLGDGAHQARRQALHTTMMWEPNLGYIIGYGCLLAHRIREPLGKGIFSLLSRFGLRAGVVRLCQIFVRPHLD
jgi:hypothetical protein